MSMIEVAEELTQFSDQAKIRLILQLTNGISRVLQRLLKYFIDTDILSSLTLSAARVFSNFFSNVSAVILIFNLNDSELVILSFRSSL